MSENGAAMSERLLSPEEVAEREGIPLATLYGWNSRGTGPRYMILGRHARYRLSDVVEWENSRYANQNGDDAA